jgi:hypothetical protein
MQRRLGTHRACKLNRSTGGFEADDGTSGCLTVIARDPDIADDHSLGPLAECGDCKRLPELQCRQ